jgi:hypothetical protein
VSSLVRGAMRRYPEFIAVAGLMLGYLLGGVLGDAVAGALLGGTAG